MASGTIYYNTTDSSYEMRLTWSSTTNSSTFKSAVTYQLQTRQLVNSYRLSTYKGSVLFYNAEDGADLLTKTVNASINVAQNSWVTVVSGSFTISHNETTGVAPAIGVGGVIEDTGSISYVAPSRDNEIQVDAIASAATITSAPNFTDEDNPTIKYSNPSGNAVTALEACIADSTGVTIYVPYRSISKTGSSYTFSLTSTERAALIAAAGTKTSLSVRFYVRTTIGTSKYLSSLGRTMTVDTGGPVISNVTITDTNATTKALTGGGTKFISGHNTMSFSFEATGQKGANVTSYAVMCGSQTIKSRVGTLTNIENETVIFSATDSRGLTSTKTVQLSAVDYIKLTCNQEVRMVLEDESSAQINVTITGNLFSGSFGAQSNSLKLYVRHARNDESMSDWVDLSPLGYIPNGNTYTLSTDLSGFDPSGTYTFQCMAVDALTTVTTEEYAVQFTPIFDWSKDDFNFNVPVAIQGDTIDDFVIDTGTEAMGTNGTWYWRKWKSGRAECYGRRNYGTMAVTTAWGGLFRSEAFTQSLPSGLFTAAPEAIDISLSSADFGGWICKHETNNPTASSSGGFIVVRPASATLSYAYIGFNVIGRWK